MTNANDMIAELTVGPSALVNYSRLSYTIWHALAEFVDNSTQSRLNYGSVIDDVLKDENTPLSVEIEHDRLSRILRIKDNSIGMNREDLVAALRIAFPTVDSKGRSRFGMGMKTAACWIGGKWRVITCEWGSGQEWTATVDVDQIAQSQSLEVPLSVRSVSTSDHYTVVEMSRLHRNIQKRSEETIKSYLGSMYRFDIGSGQLKLLYNGEQVPAPDAYDFDTDPDGKIMKRDLPPKQIGGKAVTGWIGVLRKGGRKYGGFSLFQNARQIQGYPHAWKPNSIFGGVDDEGANNLISQRLIGFLDLDSTFKVSHTKDRILFEGDEEEELERWLVAETNDYKNYAQKRRGDKAGPWSKDKLKDLLSDMSKEFTSSEMSDAVANSMLPPIEAILANNQQQLAGLSDADKLAEWVIAPDLKVVVSVQEKSEYEPHLVIVAGADAGIIHVIINGLHPYYGSLEASDAIDECIRQYVYDAIAEYRVSKLQMKVVPASVRRLKNELLRVHVVKLENQAAEEASAAAEALGDEGAGAVQ
jgi:hypothetical protein